MSLSEWPAVATAVVLLPIRAAMAAGDGYIVGLGGEADTAGGRAAIVFGDYGLTEKAWLSASIAHARTGNGPFALDTRYADAAVDYWFQPVGIRLGAGSWGDDKVLESKDLRASIYYRNDSLSISGDYERRDFDLTFDINRLPAARVIEFSGDGFGTKARFEIGDATALSFGGMTYRYSRNINLQSIVDRLRAFSTSRLGLMNSLLDYRVSAGIEWELGLRIVDLRVERWQTAIDQGRVDSMGIGFLTPAGRLSDVEFRAYYDYSENFGKTITFSVFYYFFGN